MKKSIIHIKLENSELNEARRNLLQSEVNIINIINSMKSYQEKRDVELRLKLKLKKLIAEIGEDMQKIHNNFPKLADIYPSAPEIPEEKLIRKSHKLDRFESETSKELMRIQKKLSRLG